MSIDPQYGDRRRTDTQWIAPSASRDYHGVMDKHARFIEEFQLLDESDWELFVRPFATAADSDDFGRLGWRGEFFGKMMRGACMTYQYTQSESLYTLLQSAVLRMLETQDALGRFSTYTVEVEFNGWDMWCRKYVLLGLLHFYEICRDAALRERIKKALTAHLDYIVAHIGRGDKKRMGDTSMWWNGINSASILEPVMRMYNLTGKPSYLEFAGYIVEFLQEEGTEVITLALSGEKLPYQYPVTKAYETMSCFEGLLEYYRVTGEPQWKDTVVRFADAIYATDITIIGCAGCQFEQLNYAVKTQTDTDYTELMQETCVTVTWMKLCNQLLTLTGDPKYADWIEQSCYNALYGAVNTRRCVQQHSFAFDSYSPLTLGRRARGIGGIRPLSEDRVYGCCVAIGAAGTALPLLTAVTETADGMTVNYYEAGQTTVGDFALTTETAYPADGYIRMTLTATPPTERTGRFRIPAFAGNATLLTVNGVPQSVNTGYVAVTRLWKAGDTVELMLDMQPRILRAVGLEEKEHTRRFAAVLYGPLVLARDAEFTAVGTPVDPTDLQLTVTDRLPADAILRAEVTLGVDTFPMADYASCGKDWSETTRMEAWLPTVK